MLEHIHMRPTHCSRNSPDAIPAPLLECIYKVEDRTDVKAPRLWSSGSNSFCCVLIRSLPVLPCCYALQAEYHMLHTIVIAVLTVKCVLCFTGKDQFCCHRKSVMLM